MAKRQSLVKPARPSGLAKPAAKTPALLQHAPSRPKSERAEFLTLAKARFTQSEEADSDQRTREIAALRFYAGDQWPEDVKNARQGQNANQGTGLPPIPARPCIVVNKVREPVRQVLNQERMTDMGSSIVPADDFGSLGQTITPEEIQLREGLLRKIQRESDAADARTWAFARAVIAGRGYYAITTDYAPGKTFDQDIKYRRLYQQASVSLDPAHEQPDGSDANWGFIATWVPWDEYRADYGERNGKTNRWTTEGDADQAWEAIGDEAPDWVKGDGDKPETRAVRVVEYFYKKFEPRMLAMLADGTVAWQDELPDGAPVRETRRVQQPKVRWAKIDGCDDDVLEETEWPSPYIPIIKVLGEEIVPYDDERRAQGMVEPAMSSNQGFNFMVSAMVEKIAIEPKASTMMVAGQDEGFEQEWQLANIRNISPLHYNAKVEGVPETLGPPSRLDTNPAGIQAIALSMREFDAAIRATMSGAVGLADPSVGGVDPALRSGKALKALMDQRQQGNSNFLDNLKRSVTYEGRIVNSLLQPIYGRPGRLVRLLNGQNEPESALIGVPYVMQGGPDGKMVPQPAPEGTPDAKQVTLTEGATFNVAIKVGRDFDTRRQEEGTAAGELISANPEFMAWFGDIFLKNQDWPGSDEMAKRAKVMLAPPIQQMLSQETPIPPQAQQQIAQLTQQLEATTGFAQQLHEQIQTKQVEQQGKLQEATLKEQAENEREAMRLQTEQAIAMAKLQIEMRKLEVQVEIEAAKLGSAASLKRLELEQQQLHAHTDAQLRQQKLGADMAAQEMERQSGRDEAREQRQFDGSQQAADRTLTREQTEAQRADAERDRAFQASEAERQRQAEAQRSEAGE